MKALIKEFIIIKDEEFNKKCGEGVKNVGVKRCTKCIIEYNEYYGYNCCPKCGTKLTSDKQDLYLEHIEDRKFFALFSIYHPEHNENIDECYRLIYSTDKYQTVKSLESIPEIIFKKFNSVKWKAAFEFLNKYKIKYEMKADVSFEISIE